MPRSSFMLVGAGLVSGVLIGGGLASSSAAPQSLSSAPTQLTACVVKKSGAMRLVSSSAMCRKKERAVSWNVTGPAGAQGARGEQGAPGPTGAQGAQGVPGQRGPSNTYVVFKSFVSGSGYAAVSIENVPAGFYTFTADFYSARTFTPEQDVTCTALPDGAYSLYSPGVNLTAPGTYHAGGVIEVSGAEPSNVTFECLGGVMELDNVTFALTKVETLTVQ